MKVLSIGSDRKLFEEGSAVSERISEYGTLVGELHVVVFSLKTLGLREIQLSKNVWIYPTNSSSKIFYVSDAVKLGKKIVFDRKFVRGEALITVQDPFESGWAGLKVKKRWRLPLEVQLHTDPFSSHFSGFFNIIRRFMFKRVLRNADTIRVVAEYLKERVARISKAPAHVLPIFIDKERIEKAQPSFDLHSRFGWHFVLLSVSRLTSEKKLSTALEALALVRKKYSDVGLVIVGSGQEEHKLKSLARRLKIENAVAFVGWQDELVSFYKTANAFIQTSAFEGYGLSLIEAGLYGLPILTTAVGVAKELENGRDAYIYEVGKPELFAEGIEDLIEYNHKRETLKVNIRHAIESKLISKADYMAKIKEFWEITAKRIK